MSPGHTMSLCGMSYSHFANSRKCKVARPAYFSLTEPQTIGAVFCRPQAVAAAGTSGTIVYRKTCSSRPCWAAPSSACRYLFDKSAAMGVASVTRLRRRSHLDCGDSCPSNSPRPVCQRSLCLFLLRVWLMIPLRDSQLPEADEDQKTATGLALVLMAELRPCEGPYYHRRASSRQAAPNECSYVYLPIKKKTNY